MGSPHSLLSQLKMKFLVALSLFSTSLAAPLPEADPQLLTYNNLQPAAPFTTQPIISYAHQPLAVANFASPTGTTRTYNQPPVTSYARPAFTSYARPVVHQVQTVATAPVVHHVGYKVHHQVQHVPQVSVQKHVTHHTTLTSSTTPPLWEPPWWELVSLLLPSRLARPSLLSPTKE